MVFSYEFFGEVDPFAVNHRIGGKVSALIRGKPCFSAAGL
jgi:hypothetical protein